MIVVNPLTINNSNFKSSTIQEPDPTTGEQEWLSNPNTGFDISAQGGSPKWIVKGKSTSDYYIWDTVEHKLRVYDQFFNYIRESPYTLNLNIDCIGVDYTIGTGQCAMNGFQYMQLNEFAGTSLNINLTGRLNAFGITTLNPVAVFATVTDNSNRVIHIINRVSLSEYRLIKYDFQNDLLLSNTQLDTATHGTPVDMTYRRGSYMVLYSTPTNTEIVFYNETFTIEISTNQVTGDVSDQPFDSLTIDGVNGYHLLKTSSLMVYSVTSDFRVLSSYAVGDQVIKAAIHKKYQCLIETTEDPEVGVSAVPPTWLDIGATNRWAMFDGISTYQSSYGSDVTVEVRPIGIVDSINMFNMENVSSVQVTSSIPDTGDSYTQTYDVSGKYDLVIFDFPPFENPFVDIVFTKEPLSTSSIKIGEIVVGESKRLGTLLAGAVSDRIDYSRYTYDEFGNLDYVPRPIVKYNTYPIRIEKVDAPAVELYLDGLKGKQAVWIGDIGDDEYLTARGNLERSPMTYSNPSMIEYLIKVRGSI
ncbi:hypothetical protein NVP1231O_37 [Vibrio phage 1.231.O._10N.261.49.F8]|nr:coil containing protein [Vibrio phage 1.119.O._10N.261.51.A9]AUR90409.1 coil containing protein [Vibrio phage 1.143.O._10N.261.55.C8]AUR96695.1 hypothetical protein NVP1231O_37 [Vibrio phage 1.231.O._10N.261.49.F8]